MGLQEFARKAEKNHCRLRCLHSDSRDVKFVGDVRRPLFFANGRCLSMQRTKFLFPGKTLFASLFLAGVLQASAGAVTLTVNSVADDGNGTCTATKCTLRDAFLNVHAAIPTEQIKFSLPANSTIVLTSGTLPLNNDVVIIGPGAKSLTIARSPTAAHFRIFNFAAGMFVDISGVTISNGVDDLTESAGAIHNAGNLSLTACTISGNTGNSEAGAIFNSGSLTINNCTISGNMAAFRGGAVCNSGDSAVLSINNSTISSNSAGSIGGGIQNGGPFTAAKLTISNCTFSGNTANVGGAIFNNSTDTTVGVTIANSTISGNTATGTNNAGGGIYNGKTLKLVSTIVAKNTAAAAPDIDDAGTVTSQGFNLIGNNQNTNVTAATGDQIGTPANQIDPLLGPLQDNGGPTQTQALHVNSPAIDKGNSGGSTTDQRGLTRPVDTPIANAGDGTDVGAYEVQADELAAGCPSVVVTNSGDTGAGSLRSVIAAACGGSTITFADNVRGAISLTSGELVLNKNMTINGPGANLLTVQRSSAASTNFRVFHMNGSTRNAISGLTIANGNASANLGGGISNDNGTLTLTNVMITGNTADIGAGLYNGRTANVVGSTFYGNTVSGNNLGDGGGGIYSAGGTLTVTNSTISGNTAHAPGGGDRGAGILNNLGTVTLNSCTITNNSADSGGGVMNSNNGTISAHNTIIALNTSPNGPDFNGALTFNRYNLLGNDAQTTRLGETTDDHVGTPASAIDPLLGPLQDNGGPTLTHALQPGSPALDQGSADATSLTSAITTDQRGLPRPSDDLSIPNPSFGDGSDIGAFELQVPGSIGNVSTRLPVGTGDNALFVGFTVLGPQGSSKKVIVRAIGPSLKQFGITDALANPTLEIHDSNPNSPPVATNNDWKNTQVGGLITGDQSAEISNSGVAPGDDLESAIIVNLAPGSYTAVVRGVGDTTGTGLVDAYDLSGASPARLANVATRGLVQSGDGLMIAGFIVQNAPVRAVVQGIGPSLQAFGISNALADTTLELHDQDGNIVRQNDNWKSDQQTELENTGLQPSNDLEAAMVVTLQPGTYTAQLRGKNDTSGIGVVEIYFLQ
jgi:CSLREA domain-containing protein